MELGHFPMLRQWECNDEGLNTLITPFACNSFPSNSQILSPQHPLGDRSVEEISGLYFFCNLVWINKPEAHPPQPLSSTLGCHTVYSAEVPLSIFFFCELLAGTITIMQCGWLKARGWCQTLWLGFGWNSHAISQKSTSLNRRQYS